MPRTFLFLALSLSLLRAAQAQNQAENVAFFEQNIRPLLVKNCLGCHSEQAKVTQGGLALDTRAGWQKGSAKGAVIVPGDVEKSRLLRAVGHESGIAAMPPTGKLSEREISLLAEWIKRGAPDPRDGKPLPPKTNSNHWAWQPLKKITPPTVKNPQAFANPIDRFILAKLESKRLTFSKPTDKRTLLRRVTFDLIGLPPTPKETADFLADKSPNAYEKVVDRLLASPHYGEKWGRHWLDVVHYGDTHGYDKDKRRDTAYPYRDYVIRAFNQDKPYSQFVREQLAGDVLFPNDPDGIIATGFIAAGPWDFVGQVELAEGTVEKAKTRNLDRDDMVANAVSTFNSVTVHCARCHNHKFDPISQKDYYRLQAVFAGVERGERLYAESEETSVAGSPSNGYHSAIEANPDTEKWVQVDLGKSLPLEKLVLLPARPTDFADTPGFGFPVRFRVQLSNDPTFAQAVTMADQTASDFPNPGDKPYTLVLSGQKARYVRITATKLWNRTNDYIFALAEVQIFSNGRNLARKAAVTAKDSIEQGRWSVRYLTDGADSRRAFGKSVYAVVPRQPRPIYLLSRGEVEQPQEIVEPGALSCIAGISSNWVVSNQEGEGARRAALANWLTQPSNPLTWRSIVNRVWHYHFGRGIVDTPNDFGRNGSLPTHPELLDYLAMQFRDNGQSLKKLHRLILLSAVYRQSVGDDPKAEKLDADNRLLWRMNRRRLDAEEIRDSVLAVSGTLDTTMGGAGYDLFRFKDDHSPVYDHSAVEPLLDPQTWRRTVYRFTVRSVPNPFLDCLDAADPNANTPVRNTTLTALQSLALWNNPFMARQGELFAERLRKQSPQLFAQIKMAFQLAFAREPTAQELTETSAYVQRYGLENFCRLLYNANEFVFVD